jgi:hypothetical protein
MGLLFKPLSAAEDTIQETANQVVRNVGLLCTAIFCGVGERGSKFRETSQQRMLKGQSEKTE